MGAHVMANVSIRTAIITASRPRPTVAESIASYRRAGFTNEILVFSDGGDPVVQDGVHWLENEVRLGNKRNWIRALMHLKSQSPVNDWLMICEDDIVWQRDGAVTLVEDLSSLQTSKRGMHMVGALSLFACRRMTSKAEEKRAGIKLGEGWHWENMQFGRATWGAQCMLFRRDMADWLLNDQTFREYANNESMDKNIDLIIGECLNRQGRRIMYRIPCLVDHALGYANSSLGYKDDRPKLLTDYFRGPVA